MIEARTLSRKHAHAWQLIDARIVAKSDRVRMMILAVVCGAGPRETLQERLKMFYSYWNPSVCLPSCLLSVFLVSPTRVLLSPSLSLRPRKSIGVVWYDFAECCRGHIRR